MTSYLRLIKNTPLYKSISAPYDRESIFDYKLYDTNNNNKCNKIGWFALTKEKAEYYKNKSSTASVYTYQSKKGINLLVN